MARVWRQLKAGGVRVASGVFAFRPPTATMLCPSRRTCWRGTSPWLQRTPSGPATNHGKAERFIQTALREWAYLRAYQNSNERSQELRSWLHQYNWHRPHSSLGLSPLISRAGLDRNNLLRLHI
jgi:transposase InsO family protein